LGAGKNLNVLLQIREQLQTTNHKPQTKGVAVFCGLQKYFRHQFFITLLAKSILSAVEMRFMYTLRTIA
jgi:hypothetical protein